MDRRQVGYQAEPTADDEDNLLRHIVEALRTKHGMSLQARSATQIEPLLVDSLTAYRHDERGFAILSAGTTGLPGTRVSLVTHDRTFL